MDLRVFRSGYYKVIFNFFRILTLKVDGGGFLNAKSAKKWISTKLALTEVLALVTIGF